MWDLERDFMRAGGKLILVDFHREPDVSRERKQWLQGHIRAPLETFKPEIIDAGFKFEMAIPSSRLQCFPSYEGNQGFDRREFANNVGSRKHQFGDRAFAHLFV